MSILSIENIDVLEEQILKLKDAATRAHKWIAEQPDDPLSFLKSVKFEKRGFPPVDHYEINLIEQVNQTFTYYVALQATRFLMKFHKNSRGFDLAPGATKSQAFDIMSKERDFIHAETFAATHPQSNQKLKKDLIKLEQSQAQHKYVFFAAPDHAHRRYTNYEKYGVEVWSIDV